jgi:hypothetical protein
MIGKGFLFVGICGLIIALSLPSSSQRAPEQQSTDLDEMVSHELLWDEAAAAVLAIANMPEPATEPLDKFKAAQERLERAVVQLINSRPPTPRLADHLLLMPALQEVAAAARALVDTRVSKDESGFASSKAWLDESLTWLAAALRQIRAPANTR